MKFPDALLIDGRWQTEAGGGRLELIEPATEEPLCEVPAAGKADIDRALQSAAAAFAKTNWSRRTDRADVLYRIAAGIRAKTDELARLESRNVGKPIGDALWEVRAAARCFEYYAGGISRFGGETIPVNAQGLDYTLRLPLGLVVCIVPWNFPLLMACWKVAPALATGNAVVLKPASLTPLSALALGRVVEEAGVPEGIFQVVAGRGSEIGDYLVAHPLVRKIAFTGETATGSRILKLAADRIKRVSLELGGKSPNLIFADADVEAAAAAAPLAVFGNAGQDCCARSRILVERSVYDRFLEALVQSTRQLNIGDPASEATQVGPLVSASQRQRVERYVQLAKDSRGRILCGGDRGREPGYFFNPVVVDGLPPDSRVCQEEIFGPLTCVIPFDDEEEAVRLANQTEYGLAGSLWTGDLERALRVAQRVETGVMSVNTNSSVYQEAPFGGFKQSGYGRDLGMEAMRLYTEIKNVFVALPESEPT